MKSRKTLIATAVTLMLCGQTAFAAQPLHEDEWSKVKLYGNITIAGDSSTDWGPWKEFVQPAAGGPNVPLLGALGSELYRPLVPTTPPSMTNDICGAGDLCGYAVFQNYTRYYDYDSHEGYGGNVSSEVGDFPAEFALSVQKTDSEGGGDGGYDGDVSGSFRLASLFGATEPAFPSSGELTGNLSENTGFPASYGVYMDRSASDGGEIYGQYADIKVDGSNYQSENVIAGSFYRYISGSGDGGETYTRVDGYFVAGYTTPLSDMAALQAGNVVANYLGNGTSWYGDNVATIPVTMRVNFGTSTWSGSWNGGQDGSVSSWNDSNGRVNLTGAVGFDVTNGTVSGASFNASTPNLSALDGTVTGNIQGNFYGPYARSAAGVVAITKTSNAAEPSYTTGNHTGLFVVEQLQVKPPLEDY